MTISYTPKNGKIEVKLDGRFAGFIKKVAGGYAYYAGRTVRHKGETMNSIAEVKKSLEGTDE